MDVNAIRIALTILGLAAFCAVSIWAYLPSRKSAQDARARGILEDGDA